MVTLSAIHAMPSEMPTKHRKLLFTLHIIKIFYDQKKIFKHHIRAPNVAFNSQKDAASSIQRIVLGPTIKQDKIRGPPTTIIITITSLGKRCS